jgi:hypothetical protein
MHEELQDGYGGDEWLCSMTMNIHMIRSLYDTICYSYQMWPGAPARPYEEQEFLISMKERLFAMIMEHSFEMLEVDKDK